jgi:hypothetical protein
VKFSSKFSIRMDSQQPVSVYTLLYQGNLVRALRILGAEETRLYFLSVIHPVTQTINFVTLGKSESIGLNQPFSVSRHDNFSKQKEQKYHLRLRSRIKRSNTNGRNWQCKKEHY